jgi:DnaJ family protein C protein 7
MNGASEGNSEPAPRPPPHRTPTSPPPSKNPTNPPAQPPVDPEMYKANGNKFFKAKDYANAIREYTKGIINHI